jgi:hypothetical protein
VFVAVTTLLLLVSCFLNQEGLVAFGATIALGQVWKWGLRVIELLDQSQHVLSLYLRSFHLNDAHYVYFE